jgi:GNAT superfamily N-acetyltransferase
LERTFARRSVGRILKNGRLIVTTNVNSELRWVHHPAGSTFDRSDISSVTELLHRAYAPLAAAGWNYSAASQDDGVTLDRLQAGDTIFARIDSAIVATGTIYLKPLHQLQSAVYCLTAGSSFGQFAVEPRLQSMGIGHELLSRLESLAREADCTFIACDTAEHAEHLRAYYGRRGYEPVEHVHWQGKHYNSVVLVKSLPLSVKLKTRNEVPPARTVGNSAPAAFLDDAN